MAGVAVMGGSDARAWTITSGAGCTSDFNIFTPYSGEGLEWTPGSYQEICHNNIANTGTSAGTVSVDFCELDSAGNLIRTLCSKIITLPVGSYAALLSDERDGTCVLSEVGFGETRTLGVYIPSIANTSAYYGIKTWGEHELEPGFPAPQLGLARARLAIDPWKRWVLAGGVTAGCIAALAMYMRSR